jgi:phage terminase large subunit
MTVVPAHFPEKFACLFRPARYKVFYGGRGGAKSWNIARALLLVGVQKGIRVLCVREQQNSIAESVHKLLSDQIEALGLSHLYEIQKTVIICAHTGTTFNFEGIKANVNKIKSYEGVDYVWAEEAALISKNSWDILIPTIRKPGSEIWISFNPENEDDETYKRFVLRRQPNSFVVKVTWRDNPWFPEVLRTEMEECQRTNYDDYLWIWEGNCRRVLDGAVYKHEIRKVIEEDRVTWVPYTKGIPVDVTMDLGRKDYTAIWFRQTVALQRRYIDFLQDHGRDVEYYVKAIQDRGYNIGTITLPHDAKHKRLGMKGSIEEQIRASFPGKKVVVLKQRSVMDGLNAARRVFPNCWFDAEKCAEGWKALQKYKYELIAGTTRFSDKPHHDEFSDAADAFRYDALATPGAIDAPDEDEKPIGRLGRVVQRIGSLPQGWMG